MIPEMDPAPKRTRQSASKVRTGCSTCKARRVKCDEGKPTCRRCFIKGRSCEYITSPAAPPRNVITVYVPPAYCQPVFFVNDRGLDFFHQNIAARLDGQFDAEFWSKLVLQLSHSEPAIRHAVSAISVIYRDVESSLQHPAGYVDANPEAQREWNRAVQSLSTRIQAHPNSNLVPLVCCLLFTCIEFLRGNVDSSMLHLQSGINILVELRGSSDSDADLGFNISRDDLAAIEDCVVPVFSRMNVLCCLAGRATPPIYSCTAKEGSSQEDLTDSRRRLVEILDACIRFIGMTNIKAAAFQIDVDDLVEQARLQVWLDAWREQLGELLERMHAAGKPVKQDALNLLLVHYKIVYIWLRVCTTAEETATDPYLADFEELVRYAEQFIKPGAKTTTPQPLSFDIQILGPLYYVAMKCRHPAIRRRALDMLPSAPRREGFWNAHHAYVTAKRVIELEERNLDGYGWPDETSRLHGLPLPDDQSRIYDLGRTPFNFREFESSIVLSPAFPATIEAVFQTKPWGLLGEWKTTKEYLRP